VPKTYRSVQMIVHACVRATLSFISDIRTEVNCRGPVSVMRQFFRVPATCKLVGWRRRVYTSPNTEQQPIGDAGEDLRSHDLWLCAWTTAQTSTAVKMRTVIFRTVTPYSLITPIRYYQFRISAVSVPCQFRTSAVSVPYQCRVSTVSVPSVRCPTQKHVHMYFKQNHSHISGALNGRHWHGTDMALINVYRT
jgi:hypothetical protein